MNRSEVFPLPIALCALLLAAGCSSGDSPVLSDNDGGDSDTGNAWEIDSIAVTPADAELIVVNNIAVTQSYAAIGTFGDGHTEDVTADASFSISNANIGHFSDTDLITSEINGGAGIVTATAHGKVGETGVTVEIHTVHLGEGVPEDADSMFDGTDDPARAPNILYPPDGVLLPPNLADVNFQWDAGSGNDLWQVSYSGEFMEVQVYLATTSITPEDLLWSQLIPGNGGLEPVEIVVSGTSIADPSLKGSSEPVEYNVAEQPVEGGIYYWAASSVVESDYGIYRYDFGQPGQAAEEVYTTVQTADRCVACHALSHDGERMTVTYDGGNGPADLIGVASQATILPVENAYNANFQTFSADDEYLLTVRDGVFTLRIGANALAVETLALDMVTHPAWSFDGSKVAYTRITRDYYADWYFHGGQIEVIDFNGPGNWGEPTVLVPADTGVNYYYPEISPSGDWVVFNASSELGTYNAPGDGYSDDDAHLWTVSIEGGVPIALDAVNLEGDLRTSWARWCPSTYTHKGEPLVWLAVSSMRRYGSLLADGELPQLWMAGFNPNLADNGEDPTWPAFYLPFQDITTNNHIAQWTEVVVDIQ